MVAGPRVQKDDPRLEAYGTVDELNSQLGVALAAGLDNSIGLRVRDIQKMLFVLGADLASPPQSKRALRIQEENILWLDLLILELEEKLPRLQHFILPGGSAGAVALQLARAICRRAERRVWPLVREQQASPATARFLNRLSDTLFLLARMENHEAGIPEECWQSP